jgi:hypothetical protein
VSSPPPPEKPDGTGKLTFWIPDCESVVVAVTVKPPDFPACALMYAVVPVTNVLPVAADSDSDGADGAVVSTLTVV